MRRNYWIGVILLLVLGAFALGFWPQYRAKSAAQTEVQSLQQRLDESQARVRLGGLLGASLEISDAVAAGDFGVASTLASRFFDGVRAESAAQPAPVTPALAEILTTRDAVIAALTRNEPAVATRLADHQQRLRQALGYPTRGLAAR